MIICLVFLRVVVLALSEANPDVALRLFVVVEVSLDTIFIPVV